MLKSRSHVRNWKPVTSEVILYMSHLAYVHIYRTMSIMQEYGIELFYRHAFSKTHIFERMWHETDSN